ncbi:MAG: hypothetical protein NC832_00245 [Candidatus Omnitrophica bacterium]|nr:hypothetical protein [Candidatus Omnitrophota bacterium]
MKQKVKDMLEESGTAPETIVKEISSVMWRLCGTMKTDSSLSEALDRLDKVNEEMQEMHCAETSGLREGFEAINILEVARAVAFSSLLRKETRGNFWRIDYPMPDNKNWVKNIIVKYEKDKLSYRIEKPIMTRLKNPTHPRIGAGCFPYL